MVTVADSIRKSDLVILDCDGVLVDVTNSYDKTIEQTVSHILSKLVEVKLLLTDRVIDAFKQTGGFNDEVDLTYAAIICTLAADRIREYPRVFIMDACKTIDSSGITAVEKYIADRTDISDFISYLGYPDTPNNIVHETFNQIFYGPVLYRTIFNKPSRFTQKPLIDSDILLVDENDIHSLYRKFKPAVVTGRSRVSFEYTIKGLLRAEFDMDHSMFLEDESRDIAKPNPEALIRTIQDIGARSTVYVGDSVEDLIMAQGADAEGHKTTFCGITGSSHTRREALEARGADICVRTVKDLAKILNQ